MNLKTSLKSKNKYHSHCYDNKNYKNTKTLSQADPFFKRQAHKTELPEKITSILPNLCAFWFFPTRNLINKINKDIEIIKLKIKKFR